MSAEAYFFDDGVLTVETDEETDVTVAGLQNVSINPEWEVNELYTADSGFREVAKQHSHNVNVEIEYSKFLIDAAKEWLGGAGSSSTSTEDTSDPQLFTIKVVSNSVGGDTERTAEVVEVFFPNFPLVDGSQGEFENYSLSGSGKLVSELDDTTPE